MAKGKMLLMSAGLLLAGVSLGAADVTIEAGTPVKELATWNGWRRLETPRAIGWSKSR